MSEPDVRSPNQREEPPSLATELAGPLRLIGLGGWGCGGLLLVVLVALMATHEDPPGPETLLIPAFPFALGWACHALARKLREGDGPHLITVGSWAFKGFGVLTALMGVVAAFDEPAGLVAIPFGLVFFGAGVLMKKLFAPPPGKQAVTVGGDEGPIRTPEGRPGRLAQGFVLHVDAGASESEVEAERQRWRLERWAGREDWAAGRIEDDSGDRFGFFACGAALWAFMAVVVGVVALASGDGIIGLAAAAIGGVALVLAGGAVWAKLHARKFPPSVLVLKRTPALLGQRLQGEVRTGVSPERYPQDGFEVELECVRRYEVSGSGDSGRQRRRDVLWRTAQRMAGDIPRDAPDRVVLPLDLELPSGLPSATLPRSNDGILWELSVHAALPGLDYRVSFALPVFDPAEDPTRDAATTAEAE